MNKNIKEKEKEWIILPDSEKRKYDGFKGYCSDKRMVF